MNDNRKNWQSVLDFDPDFADEVARICREFEAPALVFVKGKEKAKPKPEPIKYNEPFLPYGKGAL